MYQDWRCEQKNYQYMGFLSTNEWDHIEKQLSLEEKSDVGLPSIYAWLLLVNE